MDASLKVTNSDISPAQVRAARALLGWTLEQLETSCGLPRRTLIRFENAAGVPRTTTVTAIRTALESAGVIFIDQNGEGPGVRLKKK
jgi:transcriptional regulator with XRE-family HTH domain